MKKKINKAIGGTMLVLALAFCANISAVAADLNWNGSASTPGSSFYTGNATKNTSNSIPFINYKGSSSSIGVITQVRKYGTQNNFVNATYPGTNYVINNHQYRIHSNGYCQTRFTMFGIISTCNILIFCCYNYFVT